MTTYRIKRLNVTSPKTVEAAKVNPNGTYLTFIDAQGQPVYGIKHEHVVSWEIVTDEK